MELDRKNLWPVLLFLASLAVFHQPLGSLVQLGLENNRYSHVLLIPVISAYFLWARSESDRPAPRLAVVGCFVAAGLLACVKAGDAETRLAVLTASMFLSWVGIAMLRFSSAFPLLFLFAAIPLPGAAVDAVVAFLQNVSIQVATLFFKLAGTPAERNGLVFVFADFDVEVAKECSGLRGAISTALAATVGSQMFLESGWRRAAFVLLTIPVVILKNAVRIAGITWIGLYVNTGFFGGALHRYSGIPFTLLSIGLMLPLLWRLQKSSKVVMGGR